MKKLTVILVSTFLLYFMGKFASDPEIRSSRSNSDRSFLVSHFLNPVDPNTYFPVSGACAGCHDADETGLANVDSDGKDVNLYDQWQASIMAQSAKDPYWRAKVKHETHTLPNHASAIESKCTSCHAPAGHYLALLDGAQQYLMADLRADTLGLDGVSCGACHQISRKNLGGTFSGQINYDTNRVIFGPYPFPVDGPMREFVGFTPKFSEHITASETCAPCHTLATTVFDGDGEPTEHVFVEQATYHEWLNSIFPSNQVTCQKCHMPYLSDSVIIASGYEGLEKRYPYALHTLSGANTMMLRMMKSFGDSLSIDVADSLFDRSILSTQALLNRALDIQLEEPWQAGDSILIPVLLTNLAGHKFPSGYPSRRAWLEILVFSEHGDTLLHSGKVTDQYAIEGISDPFEPHHDTIRFDSQVQVYEGVMADINNQLTTVLDQGRRYLKDNRIPPAGFSSSHPAADTTRIEGNARFDANFNRSGDMEGTGADALFIKVPYSDGPLNVKVSLYYQSIPPEWLEELFSIEGYAEIDRFKWMYDSIRPEPELVAHRMDTIELFSSSVHSGVKEKHEWSIFPNPAKAGHMIRLRSADPGTEQPAKVMITDMSGRPVHEKGLAGLGIQVPSSLSPGLYLVRITFDNHAFLIRKLLIQE